MFTACNVSSILNLKYVRHQDGLWRYLATAENMHWFEIYSNRVTSEHLYDTANKPLRHNIFSTWRINLQNWLMSW